MERNEVVETLSDDSFDGLEHSLYCLECKVRTRIEYLYITDNNDDTYFAIAKCIDCDRLTFFHYKETKKEDTVSSRVDGLT